MQIQKHKWFCDKNIFKKLIGISFIFYYIFFQNSNFRHIYSNFPFNSKFFNEFCFICRKAYKMLIITTTSYPSNYVIIFFCIFFVLGFCDCKDLCYFGLTEKCILRQFVKRKLIIKKVADFPNIRWVLSIKFYST